MNATPISAELPSLDKMNASDFIRFVKDTIKQKEGHGPTAFNPIGYDYDNKRYYDDLPPQTADKLMGIVTLEFAALLQIAKQIPLVYAKGAITGGAYALREAIQQNAPTLHRLDEYIGSPRSKKHILRPNTRTNQVIGSYLQKQYPNHGIAAPTAREMSAKKAMQHPAFGGLQLQDVDFMALWYMLQMHFEHVAPFVSDWNATRNTNNEAAMETLIEAGLVPNRKMADIKPIDINGKPITLLDRMQKHAEIFKIALAHDIDFREAALAFCISATIDQWRRVDDPHLSHMNKRLRRPSKTELDAIDRLRAEIDPLIKTYAASTLRSQDLLPEYQKAHAQAQGKSVPEVPPDLKASLKDFSKAYLANIEDKTSINMDPERSASLRRMPTPSQRRFDSQSEVFDASRRSHFFHDEHLHKSCSEWEQALLPFAIWAMEIVLLPYNNPMVSVVLDDAKRGAHAEQYRKKHKLSHIDEAVPHAGRDAVDLIIQPAQQAAKQRVQKIKKLRPGKVVIGPCEFQFIFDVIEELRATIPEFCGRGPNKTSPAFRLLFKKAFIERNADEVFFPEKWILSPELVQLRNEARNIQCEFVERPINGPVDFHIYTESSLKAAPEKGQKNAWIDRPSSLTDDALSLTDEFKQHAARMTQAPEQGLALARLWARNQLIRPDISSTVNDDFLRSAHASLDVLDYNKKEMDTILGSPRQTGNGHSNDYYRLWGAESHETLRAHMSKPTSAGLPVDVADLLKKYAHLWIVPQNRLLADPRPDDTPQRREAIGVERRLMDGFASSQASAASFQQWIKAQRPTSERHLNAEGPQS